MSNQDWMARYAARKRGAAPQPQYQQPPAYAPPPPPQPMQGYAPPQQHFQPPPPGYPQPVGPQPLPGAPAHAPFGYDQATGVPLAPYGRDQYGNVIVQPQYAPQPWQPPQPPPQPQYDPRGQVMPQGYGQPPYGVPQTIQIPVADIDPATGQPRVHAMDAAGAWQGGKGVAAATLCPECGGTMLPTNATNESRVLNTKTGEFAHPAGHCMNCGYNGIVRPGESTGAAAGASHGVRVNVVGTVAAPGAQSMQQVAGQHGLPNLFAPK